MMFGRSFRDVLGGLCGVLRYDRCIYWSLWRENARGYGSGEKAKISKFWIVFGGASNAWKWSRMSRK